MKKKLLKVLKTMLVLVFVFVLGYIFGSSNNESTSLVKSSFDLTKLTDSANALEVTPQEPQVVEEEVVEMPVEEKQQTTTVKATNSSRHEVYVPVENTKVVETEETESETTQVEQIEQVKATSVDLTLTSEKSEYLVGEFATVSVKATANYSDGSSKDVTNIVTLTGTSNRRSDTEYAVLVAEGNNIVTASVDVEGIKVEKTLTIVGVKPVDEEQQVEHEEEEQEEVVKTVNVTEGYIAKGMLFTVTTTGFDEFSVENASYVNFNEMENGKEFIFQANIDGNITVNGLTVKIEALEDVNSETDVPAQTPEAPVETEETNPENTVDNSEEITEEVPEEETTEEEITEEENSEETTIKQFINVSKNSVSNGDTFEIISSSENVSLTGAEMLAVNQLADGSYSIMAIATCDGNITCDANIMSVTVSENIASGNIEF